MSEMWGTVTVRWPQTGESETRDISTTLPEHMLVAVPAEAAERGLSPAEFMVQHMLAAEIPVVAVDWRGPS